MDYYEVTYPKFIIYDGDIITAHVALHRDLLPSRAKADCADVVGGYWHFDSNNNTIYLYGTSEQFGAATEQQVQEAYYYERDEENILVVFDPNVEDLEELIEKYNLKLSK